MTNKNFSFPEFVSKLSDSTFVSAYDGLDDSIGFFFYGYRDSTGVVVTVKFEICLFDGLRNYKILFSVLLSVPDAYALFSKIGE